METKQLVQNQLNNLIELREKSIYGNMSFTEKEIAANNKFIKMRETLKKVLP